MNTGTIISGIGHAGLILWVLLGNWMFAPQEVPPVQVMDTTIISEARFEAAMSSNKPPAAVAEEPAQPDQPTAAETPPERPTEVAAAEPAVEAPTPVDPAPEPAPQPVVQDPPPAPEAETVAVPEPQTEAPPSDTPQTELVLDSVAPINPDVRPKPKPAAVISPEVVDAPEEADDQAAEPTPAVTEEPSVEPPVEEPPVETVAPVDTGETNETEANVDDVATTLAPTSSGRPQRRPDPAPADEPAEPQVAETATDTPATEAEPSEPSEADTAATDAALAEALGEAQADEPSTDNGPPLNFSETSGFTSAVGKCWSLGAASTAVMNATVIVYVAMLPDGTPDKGSIRLVESSGDAAGATQAFEAARRAILRCAKQSPMPTDKYGQWKELELVFDPSGMRLR